MSSGIGSTMIEAQTEQALAKDHLSRPHRIIICHRTKCENTYSARYEPQVKKRDNYSPVVYVIIYVRLS